MITIEIHEFSTGILVEGKEDDWFSRGFTGEYMNCTLETIPAVVQQAISNQEFALAERAATEYPALIARELKEGEEEWSIVAVITTAKDDFGRYLTVYRYFLTEGLGKIAGILRWMNNQFPVFNPFEQREVGQSYYFSYDETTQIPIHNFQDLITSEIPLIIPTHTLCNPLIINSITAKKAVENLVAWAYNVGDLAVAKSFYVIYPSDQVAETRLRQKLSTEFYSNKVIIGEEGLKKAIVSLISRNEVKLEHLETLESALSKVDLDEKYWEEIFAGRGAINALQQLLYSEQMVRLLTLRAIALPNTLPQFLVWMTQNKKKQAQNWSISLAFQANLLKNLDNLPQISTKIQDGVSLLLLQLLDKPELLHSVIYLLKNKSSIWAYFYQHTLRKSLEHDLTLISEFINLQQKISREDLTESALSFQLLNGDTWKLILADLILFWPPNYQILTIKKYQVWGELFTALKHDKLATVFYQIATDEVPKSIFQKVSNSSLVTNIFGLPVYSHVNWLETILLNFGLTK